MQPVMNVDEVTFDDVEENGLYTSSRGQKDLRKMFRAETTVDYYDRETT